MEHAPSGTAATTSATAHTPWQLRVESAETDSTQFIVENADLYDGQPWGEWYVRFSGYFGSYGPHVFAAAPQLLDLLRRAEQCISAAVRIEQSAHDEPPAPVSQWDYEADHLAHECRTLIARVEAA